MSVMSCMKCGREIPLGQAFCKDCLEDMSHYPVNPATPVHIPIQPPTVNTNRRNNRARKARKPEEQILRLRKTVRIQAILILLLLTALIAGGILGYSKLYAKDQTFRPGENYLTTEVFQQHSSDAP